MYRAFLGAPTLADLSKDPGLDLEHQWQWRTISSASTVASAGSSAGPCSASIDQLESEIRPGVFPLRAESTTTSDTSIPNPSFGFTIPSAISTRLTRPQDARSDPSLDACHGITAIPSVSQPERRGAGSIQARPSVNLGRKSTLLSRSLVGRGHGSFSQASVVILPPDALEAASQRVSMYYRGAIFEPDGGDGVDPEMDEEEGEGRDEENEGYTTRGEQTTVYTWPPTAASETAPSRIDTTAGPSFLHTTTHGHTTTGTGFYETQEEFETQDQTYNTSSSASIAQFPSFHFSLHSLTSLGSLAVHPHSHPHPRQHQPGHGGGKMKLSLLLAILEVDGPSGITLKKGPDAGKEVSILTMVLGDEEGRICKLTAWREVADDWGGVSYSGQGEGVQDEVGDGVRRGDVVYIENVTSTTPEPSPRAATVSTGTPHLTASPSLGSRLQICYRTMPRVREDARLRPDLRLGASDAGVRKVAGVVAWFERMAGLR